MSVFEIKNSMIARTMECLEDVLHGKGDVMLRVLICVFSGGHMLLEDIPGLGKTTVAVAAARALGMSFGRVQCTNDLLPTDVTGLNIFKADRGAFEFHPGPIFNNLVLVDEINRATPKTQSALLEAMGEEQATIDGTTYKMATPFIIVATQNPIEHSGTFPLPESQMDRFMMKSPVGYPDRDSERDILRSGSQKASIENLPPVFTAEEVAKCQRKIDGGVTISDKILDYILSISEATRHHPMIEAGISTRGAMTLSKCARCVAWMRGRDYVVPEDVKIFASDILEHRIQLVSGSKAEARRIIESVLGDIPAP
ncbi:MAG: MoxR family ATPase [Synergistaceae bacterium]|jgi:MoxR-like ATPase|nr:MoxR family ATPase [Synergistaceae bacterium]